MGYFPIDFSIALINAARSPPSSKAFTPLIVDPAGDVTLSFKIPGCKPEANCIFPDPKTV